MTIPPIWTGTLIDPGVFFCGARGDTPRGEPVAAQHRDVAHRAADDNSRTTPRSGMKRAFVTETAGVVIAIVDHQDIAGFDHLQCLVGHDVVAGETKHRECGPDHPDVFIDGADLRTHRAMPAHRIGQRRRRYILERLQQRGSWPDYIVVDMAIQFAFLPSFKAVSIAGEPAG
jgi:hypothetical protein